VAALGLSCQLLDEQQAIETNNNSNLNEIDPHRIPKSFPKGARMRLSPRRHDENSGEQDQKELRRTDRHNAILSRCIWRDDALPQNHDKIVNAPTPPDFVGRQSATRIALANAKKVDWFLLIALGCWISTTAKLDWIRSELLVACRPCVLMVLSEVAAELE